MTRLLLLHCNWKLAFSPSCLRVASIRSHRNALLSFSCTHLSCTSCIAVHHLSSKSCSVFFSLFDKAISILVWLRRLVLFALDSSNVSSLWLPSIIVFRNCLSLLFENPVVLVVIVMPSLIHEVFEDFSEVVVVRSLFKL